MTNENNEYDWKNPSDIVRYVVDHPGSNGSLAERISAGSSLHEIEGLLDLLATQGLSHEPLYRKLSSQNL